MHLCVCPKIPTAIVERLEWLVFLRFLSVSALLHLFLPEEKGGERLRLHPGRVLIQEVDRICVSSFRRV